MSAARLAALVVLALGALAAAAWAAAGDTQLVSRATGASGAAAESDASLGGISGDGRFVVFDSLSNNLAGGGLSTRDVFVRDTVGGGTFLVSEADGVSGNGESSDGSASSDAGFIAFATTAINFDPAADSNPDSDVYVRDMTGGAVTLASRVAITGPKGNAPSTAPAISSDGRHVAFESQATNLPDDTDPAYDVFVRDLETGITTLVSRADTPTGASANGDSRAPSISADGRFVAFHSAATNLPDDTDGLFDVFVRDVVEGTTTLVSRQTGVGGPKGSGGPSVEPQITPSGRHVSFGTFASNLGGSEAAPAIVRRDLQAATTTPASVSASGATVGITSFTSGISGDGRLVAFASGAANVHPDDTDGLSDVFLRDVQAGTTALLSRASGAAGQKGNGNSGSEGPPAVSANGAFVAFGSRATNLHPDDTDSELHVFTRELGQPAQPPPPPPPPPPPAGPPSQPPIVEPPLPRPVAGRSELVEVVSGVIRIRQRGTRRFVRVRADTFIRDGSEIDARRGVLRLVVAAVRDGSRTSSVLVSRGRAIVDQNRARRPLTTLRLSGPLTTGRRASAAQRRKKRRRGSRSLFTETDGGRFRTRGNYGAATASGTAWLTTDRATTTKVTVFDGRVRVRDLVRRRTITVRAPNSYTARRNARRR